MSCFEATPSNFHDSIHIYREIFNKLKDVKLVEILLASNCWIVFRIEEQHMLQYILAQNITLVFIVQISTINCSEQKFRESGLSLQFFCGEYYPCIIDSEENFFDIDIP